MKGQKGITLVALVITIIVMLILAGVTISMVVNGGLFTQAQESVTATKKSNAKEYAGIAVATQKAKIEALAVSGTYRPMGTATDDNTVLR